jgi:RNA polymerase-interacting CarD/CdnL/TRCF family regulator
MAKKSSIKKPVKSAKTVKTVKAKATKAKKTVVKSVKTVKKPVKAAAATGKVISIKAKLAAKSSARVESGKVRDHYKIGDVLFYPRQGLCKFETTMREYEIDFYQLRPLNPQMSHATIRVPVGNVEKVGLRRPSSTMTFDAACAYLRKLPNEFETDWRKRNATLTEQTMRGYTTDLLSAAKTFALQDAFKPLSHQERRQYEQIVQFAADEIALVEHGTGATVAGNLMEFMRQLVSKTRPAVAGAAGR